MLTTTERFTSIHGESTNGKPYPMHKPSGDSCVLLIPVGPNFTPNGATSTPGERSLKMPRDLANGMAVSLNRTILRNLSHCPHWHVVLYAPRGFYVIKVQVPEDWQAEDEYSLPPTHISDVMNAEARQQVKVINKSLLSSGRSIKHWAVHVKPLKPTVQETRSEPSEAAPEEQQDEKPVTLSEDQQRVVGILNESLNGSIHVVNDGYALRFFIREMYIGESTQYHTSEPAGIFRKLAGQLLDAANKLEGEDGPTIGTFSPLYHEFFFEGFEPITLRVDVNSAKDEEKALQTARQFLLAHSNSK